MGHLIKDFLDAVNHMEPSRIPVAFWGPISPSLMSFMGVGAKSYYLDAEVKLKTQLDFLNMFPEAIGVPGIWPEFGSVALPSAMGCEVIWLDDDAPVARPMLTDINDVLKLKSPDPGQAGFLSVELQQWEYFWRHTDKRFIDEYGYLDGAAYTLGPVEAAGLMRGYTDFFVDLYLHPKLIHQLLEINTETIIKYLKATEKINGKIKRLAVADHIPTQISPEHVKEFWLPYLSAIYKEFHYAEIRLWHNEGSCRHILPLLRELGANVWHFGDDSVAEAKKSVGDCFCLMGNLHPVHILANGDYTTVFNAAVDIIKAGSQGGGLWLSSGGGMAPGTPKENIQAIIDASKHCANGY